MLQAGHKNRNYDHVSNFVKQFQGYNHMTLWISLEIWKLCSASFCNFQWHNALWPQLNHVSIFLNIIRDYKYFTLWTSFQIFKFEKYCVAWVPVLGGQVHEPVAGTWYFNGTYPAVPKSNLTYRVLHV